MRTTLIFLTLALLSATAPAAPPSTSPTTRPTWTPPKTTLPPQLVSAVRSLFLDGEAPMSDPTPGEYRQVTLQITGPFYGNAITVTTNAWVLNPNSPAPRAVCWNGLTYPVLKLGEKADLHAEMTTLLKNESAAVDKYLKIYKSLNNYNSFRFPRDDSEHVASNILDLQHVTMLLRVGEVDLAEKSWALYTRTVDNPRDDIYESLADAYIQNLLTRGLGSFGRGDDVPALASLHACAAVCDIGRKIYNERNPNLSNTTGLFSAPSALPDPFAQFAPITLLIPDLERRIKFAPYDPVLLHPEKYRDKKARIAALIRDLELVGNYPAGSTEKLQIMPDVMVDLLTAEGDDIVEPLIQCYEHDTRYTRCVMELSVGMSVSSIDLTKVHEIARIALSRITGIWLDDSSSNGGTGLFTDPQHPLPPIPPIQAFRTSWEKQKKIPRQNRQYAILSDDALTPGQRSGAALLIVGRTIEPHDTLEWNKIRDVVRQLAYHQRSVHDLLVKGFRESKDDSDTGAAEEFIDDLVVWDGKAALDIIRDYQPRLYFAPYFYDLRAKFGDPLALHDYALWLQNLSPKDRVDISSSMPRPFAPLWQYPNDPAAKAAAEWAFQFPDSPWNPLLPLKPTTGEYPFFHTGIENGLHSPLLSLPPFRRQVLALFDNKEEIGTVTANDAGDSLIEVKDGWIRPNAGPVQPPDIETLIHHPMLIRPCDIAAALVTLIPGAPRYEIFWNLTRRDAAIANLKDFLTRYGSHIDLGDGDSTAEMSFAPLAAPATPEQLAAGNAIFSLAGQGTAKIVTMQFPKHARWFTNKDFPAQGNTSDPITFESIPVLSYFNEGTLWQAEDLTTNGKIQRYFGFVWKGGMTRVPAEQIEFPAPWQNGLRWNELPDGIDITLISSGTTDVNDRHHLTPSDPALLTLRLRNRRAVPQPIDPILLRQNPAAHTLFLRAGLTLHLVKLRPGADPGSIADPAKTTPVAPRFPITSFTPDPPDPTKSLRQPEEEFNAATLDLRDYFDLSQPGTYGLWLTAENNPPIATPPACLILHPSE